MTTTPNAPEAFAPTPTPQASRAPYRRGQPQPAPDPREALGASDRANAPRAQRRDLATVTPGGQLELSLHPGQWRAWNSNARFIGVIAGAQSGKTSFGPHWLLREIQRSGPGDYLVVTPTFQLLEKKLLPEFRRVFEQWFKLGAYIQTPARKFKFSLDGERRTFATPPPDSDALASARESGLDLNDPAVLAQLPRAYAYVPGDQAPTTVWFGYADDPESLESMTAKAAWLDEAGQKRFRLASWHAVRRRLAIHRGRALITTTPYDLGWLKQEIYDRAIAGHPDYEIVNFASTMNPAFSEAEFEDVRATMQPWLFDLFYNGIFTQPAGIIYGCFVNEYRDVNPDGHKLRPFPIPDAWRRYVGIDFGGVNTRANLYAEEPMDPARLRRDPKARPRLVLYKLYAASNLSAARHVRNIIALDPVFQRQRPIVCGGSASEDQWRREFTRSGLRVIEPPIKDVEVGINRVYAATARGEILVFDTATAYIEEKTTYSREVDDSGNILEDIEDKKKFHHMDAERYIIALLRHGACQRAGATKERSAVAVAQQYARVGPFADVRGLGWRP